MNTLRPAERLVLLLVAATCLFFAVLTPPFQVPDEPQHLSRAWSLAHGRLFAERRGAAVGGEQPMGYARLSSIDFPRESFDTPTRYRPGDLAGARAPRAGDDGYVFVEFANVATYAPTLYAPQVAAIIAGERAGLRPLACFYLARLFNAAAFLLLLWAAVRAIPFGRPVLLAVAALPTATFQAASVSPDATIEGLAWLVIGLSLRLGWTLRREAGAALGAAAVPLGLAKGLYAPVALAGARRGTLLRHGAAFVLAAGAFVLWTRFAGADQPTYQVMSRTTGRLVTTAPAGAQLHVVLADPARFVRVLASSMAERSPVYALQIVGRFGWNAILLPLLAYPLALIMLAAGIVSGLGQPVGPASRWWWAALAIGGAVLVEVALYLTGTPLAADYVQGTQGRYFLPLLPLVGLATAPASGRPGAERWLAVAAVLLNAVALAAVLDAFWLHGFANHRGLPPFTHNAAGVARALLLPSPRW